MRRSAGQIRKSLFALTTKGIKYDLDRISAAAASIGNPQKACPAFHVAGTNGKGSTCAFIESVLRAAGYATGLFTSPHITDFEERFRINGRMIGEEEWVAVYHDLEQCIAVNNLTFFEATMLIGSEVFRRRGVEWAVFETGLGGRLDATNILRPQVSVITRVSMDHREYLGNTIGEVMTEKLGIVKETVPLAAVDPETPDLRKLIQTICGERNAPFTMVSAQQGAKVCSTAPPVGTSFVHDGHIYTSRLAGDYQAENALLAITAIRSAAIGIKPENLQKGIAEAYLPGRFQQLRISGKTVVFDVGHNPDAAAVLCRTLRRRYPGKSICFVAGIMADKEYPEMLREYGAVARHIICTRPDTGRAATAEMLASHLSGVSCSVCPAVGGAFDAALRRPEEVVCVTGSFYTVGEASGGLLSE